MRISFSQWKIDHFNIGQNVTERKQNKSSKSQSWAFRWVNMLARHTKTAHNILWSITIVVLCTTTQPLTIWNWAKRSALEYNSLDLWLLTQINSNWNCDRCAASAVIYMNWYWWFMMRMCAHRVLHHWRHWRLQRKKRESNRTSTINNICLLLLCVSIYIVCYRFEFTFY